VQLTTQQNEVERTKAPAKEERLQDRKKILREPADIVIERMRGVVEVLLKSLLPA